MKKEMLGLLAALSSAAAFASAYPLSVDGDRSMTPTEQADINSGSYDEVSVSGTGTLTMLSIGSFAGTITVNAGVAIKITAAEGLGKSGAVTDVKSGATLIVNGASAGSISLSGRTVKIAGTGVDGAGAVCMTGQNQNYLFYKLELTGDAAIGGDKTWGSINTGVGSFIDMGGNTLTICAGCMWRFTSMENPGDIDLVGGSIQATGGAGFVGGDAHVFSLDGGTLSLYDWRVPTTWTLRVKKTTSLHPGSGTEDNLSNVWSGPIEIDSGCTLGFTANGTSAFRATFAGPISGAGGLVMKTAGTLRLLSPTNTFTGGIDMGNNGRLYAAAEESVPRINGSLALPTMTSSCRLTVVAGSASNPDGWTATSLAEFLGSSIAGYVIVEVAEGESVDLGEVVTALPNLSVSSGEVEVSGPESGALRYFGDVGLALGALRFSDTLISFFGNGATASAFTVGSAAGQAPVARTTFGAGATVATVGTADSGIKVGCVPGTVGVVEIEDGAIVTNKFDCGLVAAGDKSKMTAGVIAAGAVYQRGGELSPAKGAVCLADNFGYGYYELAAGVANLNWVYSIGGRNGIGVFRQKGGTLTQAAQSMCVSQGGTGVVYQTAGSLKCTDQDLQLGETRYTGGEPEFVSFANYTIAGTATTETRNIYGARHSNMDAYLNLADGGTLLVNVVHKGVTPPTSSKVESISENRFFVNFDGGVLKERLNNQELFSLSELPDRVTVYPRGAVIDSGVNTVNVGAPLQAPGTGLGVTDVVFAAKAGYIGAPHVEIVGNGEGATAVAEFDSASGTVTGVTVTSPGFGYTEATAVLTGGGLATAETASCQLGDVTGGGLVKRGTGTVNLNAANTYTGVTCVEAGKLAVGATGSIADGGAGLDVRAGATLDLGGKALTTSSVAGGGTISNGDVTLAGTVAFSGARFGETTVLSGSLAFAADAHVVFTVEESQLPARSVVLATAAGGVVLPQSVQVEGLPDGYSLLASGSVLKVKKDRGMILLFR